MIHTGFIPAATFLRISGRHLYEFSSAIAFLLWVCSQNLPLRRWILFRREVNGVGDHIRWAKVAGSKFVSFFMAKTFLMRGCRKQALVVMPQILLLPHVKFFCLLRASIWKCTLIVWLREHNQDVYQLLNKSLFNFKVPYCEIQQPNLGLTFFLLTTIKSYWFTPPNPGSTFHPLTILSMSFPKFKAESMLFIWNDKTANANRIALQLCERFCLHVG